MSGAKILVVDDEARIRKLLKDFLGQKGFVVIEAEDGKKAVNIFEEKNKEIDMILLDVMMPNMDGWSTLREIRKMSKVPVIMITARGEEHDELFGYELGVDQYISKPFSPKVLVARVEALLKRTKKEEDISLEHEGIFINTKARTVIIDEKNVDFTLMEYELLKYLILNKNIALSRDKIISDVWEYDYYGETRTIDSHIKKIRKKLGKKGILIQTIRGVGYKFGAEPK
ncbi:MAG: response regulator transcription factor [Clostridia bacterium]|nr:response regulator transcription factor [Clostridia bacterium]MDD4375262.1 response regulator transcription factor [Clostridia bacterium]